MCGKCSCEAYDLGIKHLAEDGPVPLGLTIGDVVELGQELQERGNQGPAS